MNKTSSRKKGKIFILSGPSGSGKTTLHEQLLFKKNVKKELVKTISATTRKRRAGERHGKDYLFFSEKQFLHRIKMGYFLEWQRVFSDYYGTPKKPVEKILTKGENVLLCIDVKGARVVFKKFKDAVGIFVKTPSFAILKKRLEARASENKKTLQKRLAIAKTELKEARHYRYVVVNDVLVKALKKLETIILKELL